jgi:hypothetical protein
MTVKRLSELSDDELRLVIGDLMARVQELEMHLAEAVALILCTNGDVQVPSEQEYLDTVEHLTRFLMETTQCLRVMHEQFQHN